MKSIHDLLSMKNRTALITGGAGNIGLAMGMALAEAGCSIALLDLDQENCTKAAEAIEQQHGVRTQALSIDLADEDDVRSVPNLLTPWSDRLDVLINCAGFVGTSDLEGWVVPFEEQTTDTWRKALEVNLTAVFALTQACAPLLKQNRGSIINISSIYGTHGPDMALYEGTAMGNPAAYAASKGGLLQLTRWLATVLAPDIRVNAISPGGIARGQDPTFISRYESRTPLGRMGTEEDVKGTTLYLASDLSAYVTGQNLIVDGGWTVW